MLSICFRCTVCTSIAIFYEAEDKTKREKIPHLHLLHKIVFFVFPLLQSEERKIPYFHLVHRVSKERQGICI